MLGAAQLIRWLLPLMPMVQVAAFLREAKLVLDTKLDKLEHAKASGNMFELKMAEKTLTKSLVRLQKMVTKGKAEDRISTPRSPMGTNAQGPGFLNPPRGNGNGTLILESS